MSSTGRWDEFSLLTFSTTLPFLIAVAQFNESRMLGYALRFPMDPKWCAVLIVAPVISFVMVARSAHRRGVARLLTDALVSLIVVMVLTPILGHACWAFEGVANRVVPASVTETRDLLFLYAIGASERWTVLALLGVSLLMFAVRAVLMRFDHAGRPSVIEEAGLVPVYRGTSSEPIHAPLAESELFRSSLVIMVSMVMRFSAREAVSVDLSRCLYVVSSGVFVVGSVALTGSLIGTAWDLYGAERGVARIYADGFWSHLCRRLWSIVSGQAVVGMLRVVVIGVASIWVIQVTVRLILLR